MVQIIRRRGRLLAASQQQVEQHRRQIRGNPFAI